MSEHTNLRLRYPLLVVILFDGCLLYRRNKSKKKKKKGRVQTEVIPDSKPCFTKGKLLAN